MNAEDLERVLGITAAGVEFDRPAFDRELARFRRQGYALSRGQRVPGLTAIAVPIFDINGHVPHCLSLTGPSVRVDTRDLDLAEIMMVAGRDLSNRLGASPEHALDLRLLLDDASGETVAPAKRKAAAKKESAAATKAKKVEATKESAREPEPA
jgi:hypothetical protein